MTLLVLAALIAPAAVELRRRRSSSSSASRSSRPATQFQGTQFGGLSGFAYDQHRGVFYALSDDQTNVRFYTLRVDVSAGVPAVQILAVTTLPRRHRPAVRCRSASIPKAWR